MTHNKVAAVSAACLLAIVLLTLSGPSGAQANGAKCPPARHEQMDNCAAHMGFLGDHSFRVPKNTSSMSTICGQLKESIQCIQSYSRDCLQGFTRQILMSLLKRGKQQYNLVCQDEKARSNLIDRMSCLAEDKMERVHSCMDASLMRYEFIRSNVSAQSRIPSLCCSHHIFERDLEATLERECGKRSSKSANGVQEFFHKLVGGTTGEFYQLMCDRHHSMAECRASERTRDWLRKLEQVTKEAKAGKLKARSKSLIPPLLEILESSEPI